MRNAVALAAAAALTLGAPAMAADAAKPAAAPEKPAAACNRACLERVLDRYVDALIAHDPKHVAMTTGFRATENTRPMKAGDGMWRTISGRGSFAFTVADPKTGQVGEIATLRENGRPVLVSLRLRVSGGKVSEAEAQVLRQENAANNEEKLGVNPLWTAALAPDERVSREKMMYAANQYFSGIVAMDGTIVPFDPNCHRVENGSLTANNPNARPSASGFNLGPHSCTENLSAKLWTYITDVTNRRHNFVDEERGIVWSQVIFPHEGGIMSYYQPGFGTLDQSAAARRPFDTHIAEIFKVQKGKITEIQAVILSTPYGMDDGGWTREARK